MRFFANLVCLGALILLSGCQLLFENDLDRAYRQGEITGEQYTRISNTRLKKQKAEQAYWQQQQKNNQRFYQNLNATINKQPQLDWGNWAAQNKLQPNQASFGSGPVSQQSQLPTGSQLNQIQKGQGVFTGRTQIGADGKLWREYRLADGTTYWRLT